MLKPEHRGILEAYAAGINAYVDSVSFLPLEFWIMGINFNHWAPKDALMVFKLFSFELSGNWRRTMLRTLVRKQLGKDWAERLFPLNDGLLEDTVTISLQESNETHRAPAFAPQYSTEPQGKAFSIGGRATRLHMGNAWVVHGNFTDIRKPILANDLLFEKQIPGVFYLASLRFPNGNVVTGGTIVGVPAVVVGRNRDLAWGITPNTVENIDVYDIQLSEYGTSYMLNGKYVPLLGKKEEVINIKGKRAVSHTVYSTVYGPLAVSYTHLTLPTNREV
eukprot:TRINITY_DN2060_c0_g2_i1.p1 TRINITY_DN2060_c0_g2~~TRINITY_DN2060_c0_g2_i1.p1  ORF type:complete len:277 (+),score=44.55 TRINITY_DN2060_c0_g2_i1:266-1096(+)